MELWGMCPLSGSLFSLNSVLVMTINVCFTVSKQTLNADILSLKKGIDLTKTERDKQPNNFVLFVSFE